MIWLAMEQTTPGTIWSTVTVSVVGTLILLFLFGGRRR